MLLAQRSYVFVPCPVHLALRPTAKLAYDMGRGSQSRVWYSTNKGEIQTLNITINQTKQGCPKMPLRGLGVQACNNWSMKFDTGALIRTCRETADLVKIDQKYFFTCRPK